MTVRIALIGYGKIAHDEHWPSIRSNPAFELVAVAGGRSDVPAGVPRFADHVALLAANLALDAVAICTPPGPRHAIARDCLNAGCDVLLEKPPTATLGELDDLVALAARNGRTLFAAWHSQFAPAVVPAAAALAGCQIDAVSIIWCEDVRRWHPGQDWVLGAGGFGVLDAGINALSIASRILPDPLLVDEAQLMTPANRHAPIAAQISFVQADCHAHFDWRATDAERRTISVRITGGGFVEISGGGTALAIDGVDQPLAERPEYPPMYARFAELIAARQCDVDAVPLRLVADALLVAEHVPVDRFDWS